MCHCEPSMYCSEDNLTYPAIQCEECQQADADELTYQIEKWNEYFQMICKLREWSGSPVTTLRKGKPKHKKKPVFMYSDDYNDDLPF